MPSYVFGPFRLDGEARTLLRDGEAVALTGKTFDTLLLLVQRRGRLVSRDELLSAIWRNTTVEEANLNQAIFSVRKVLGDRPKDHLLIATVPGFGYQFVAHVTEVVEASQMISPQPNQTKISSKQSPHRHTLLWLSAGTVVVAAALLVVSLYNAAMRPPSLATMVQLTNDGKPKNELVTDGVRVFYAAPMQQNLLHWRTYEVPVRGGESKMFPPMGQDMSPFGISPDHADLLLGLSSVRQSTNGWATPNQLWLQPLAGGPASLSVLRAQDASWSSKGEIVYAVGRQIWLTRKNDGRCRKLADLPGVPSGLRWSPRGDAIRFTLHHGIGLKDSAIWELSSEGGKAHPLFPDLKSEQGDGEWMPGGKYYLFSRTDKGGSQIWALREPTPWLRQSAQRPVQLTTGPMQCFLPTPTPDGKRLLFLGVQERTSILKQDRKTGQFAPFLPGVSGAHLDFSRDGKWVTYSSYPDHALWRTAADGTHRLQLSPPGMVAILPAISPDGTRVAFVGGFPGLTYFIFVVGVDGGALQRIVSTQPTGLGEPVWSPDGASLALATLGDNSPLYRFDFANARLAVLPGSEALWSPRWSPDGQFLAALSSTSSGLMLYNVRECRQTKLTDVAAFNPVWSQDGRYIYFGSGNEDEAWYRVRLRDLSLERVVSLAESGALPAKPSRGVPTWIYRWTGLAPDDSLLVAREAGSMEIYSADWVEP